MNQIKEILIDLREEFELLNMYLISTDKSLLIVNIPMRSIFSNVEWISTISTKNNIYLMCRSSVRSKKVKDKYFKNNNNIKSIDGGIKKIEMNKLFRNRIKIIKGDGGFGLQQYMQLAFIIMLFLVLVLLYLGVDTRYVEIFIIILILFIIYQLYIQSCWIGSMVPLSNK
ncbi:hypothetical protein Indivirus_5_18 [Indivirus ILV1]|uniref:Uncharacterized protein n=1 Tax=Indivirus ILV1 TaxID=1977633 RepID=A0A1V0SDV5_9VIRU|nr:hypothetical protein Indivirus_5_18 [Indivirus ILV1]